MSDPPLESWVSLHPWMAEEWEAARTMVLNAPWGLGVWYECLHHTAHKVKEPGERGSLDQLEWLWLRKVDIHDWLSGRKLRTYMGYTNLMFYVCTQEQMTKFYKLTFFLYSLIVFIETCIMRTRGRVGSNTNFPREDVQESHIFWKQWPWTCERVYWCGYCTKKKLHVLSGFCSSWPCLPGPREF